MIEIETFQNKQIEIKDFKTTYIVLKFNNELFRFDFKGKKEAFLKQRENGILKFYIEHPLLLNYNESNLEVFINSKPENHNEFINDIEQTINKSLQGWRNWKDYIEINTGINFEIFNKNVENGTGKLLSAPISIIEKIELICDKHNVKIKTFGKKQTFKNELIFINNQFIIAEKFLNNYETIKDYS
ncbi:hypothetical protein [Empedobacter tilapiae]